VEIGGIITACKVLEWLYFKKGNINIKGISISLRLASKHTRDHSSYHR
jgi:hypothetical protein